MALKERQALMREIELARDGRTLICFFNFDRESTPRIPGIQTQFLPDTKESFFRVIKETVPTGGKVDVCIYTRGGDTNAVWPIASLLREFDPDFEVLVPFRCHSGGTLLALAAKRIILGPMSELSPIDPSTGNQFNPSDPAEPRNRLAISVEDVQAYKRFVLSQFDIDSEKDPGAGREALRPFLGRLAEQVHPLALGNVHRVHQQIQQLAQNLLNLHPIDGRNISEVIKALTTRFYSHLHMINRHEAREILGTTQVAFASAKQADLLDALLRSYEDDFRLRSPYFLSESLGDELVKDARFVGGAVESKTWSYHFETKAKLRQHSAIPPNVQVQLPPGQPMPLIPGLPREYGVEIISQGWVRNTSPKGVTL